MLEIDKQNESHVLATLDGHSFAAYRVEVTDGRDVREMDGDKQTSRFTDRELALVTDDAIAVGKLTDAYFEDDQVTLYLDSNIYIGTVRVLDRQPNEFVLFRIACGEP